MKLRRVQLLIWKEFRQLRRDPMLLRLLLVMPVMQLLMFGYVVATEIRHLTTAIVDLDQTAVSRKIESVFAGSGYFSIVHHPTSEAELRPLLDRGQAQVAIIIPEGTQDRLLRGENAGIGIIVDGSDSQVSAVGGGYASQIIARINAERRDNLGMSIDAPQVNAQVRVLFNPTMDPVNVMIPGLIAAIVMVSLMVIMSQAVVKERESGTLEQMFVTPIRAGEYLLGKVTPYAVLATLQMLLVAVAGTWWFKVPFNGDLAVVVVGMILFMLTSIGLGLLISLVSRTRHQAQQAVALVMIPTMVLSGFIFPIQSMPEVVQPLAWFIPMTWALEVLRGAFLKSSDFSTLALPLAFLTGFAVVLFGAAVLATRRRITS